MEQQSTADGLFRQVIVIALDGFGAGAQPDAAEYRDRGTNTLSNVATYVDGLDLALLQWLGLGNITPIRGVAPADPPAASYGRLARASAGRDAKGALHELIAEACDRLIEAEKSVIGIGEVATLLDRDHIPTIALSTPSDLIAAIADTMHRQREGLIIATVASGDASGRRGGPVAVQNAIERLDVSLGALLDHHPEDTLLMITSLGGADATIASGRTREYVPLLAYTPALPSGIDLGVRASLSDVGATAAEVLGVGGTASGSSFFAELLA